MQERHIIAYCIEANHEYRIDLYHYGVRASWPPNAIWDVAKREMKLAWGKDVTCWG
jgi:hypothetical protein